jgi:hypothetical protein
MSCSPLKVNQCFGEHVASSFRVEEYAKQHTRVKPVAGRTITIIE